MEAAPDKKRFNWDSVLTACLSFSQHARLMVLLFCAGCLIGVGYFVFATPLYSSTALLNINNFSLPVSGETGSEVSTPGYLLNRRLVDYLRTERFTKRVAVEKGWASEETSASVVRATVTPVVLYFWLDSNTLQVNVMSRFADVVREFPESLVEVYRTDERERRREYREKGIALYLGELEQLRSQLNTEMDVRFNFERERNLTDLFIEQRKLDQVPKELVLVKSRIEQLEGGIEKLGVEEKNIEVIERLAVLVRLEREAVKMEDIDDFTRKRAGDSPLVDLPSTQSNTNTDIFVQPVVLESWEAWERERRKLVEDLATQSGIYLPDHPVIQELDFQIASLSQRLETEYNVRLERLRAELTDLDRRQKNLQEKMPDYDAVTREYEEFRRDYSLLTKSELGFDKMFEDMSKKVAALEYSADKERIDINFGGYVNLRDENPVSPNKTKLLTISLALGFALAIGVPFLLTSANRTTLNLSDLEDASGITGIGAVPLVSQVFLEDIVRSPMLDASVPNALLENFRLIRANVCLHPGRKGASQVVMVTSARPGEGKSTQAANLAWAFFSMGERTLLIDCDLRRGRQHELTQVSNRPGLTHLLTGQASLDEVILPTRNNNLDVIPRGPVIAGSTEVLCQQFFDQVVAELRTRYQRIVIDTPPVLGLSETASLQRLTDGVVVIVKAEVTARRDSLDAIDKLNKAGAHIFGFVLNGIDLTKLSNRYHYYYYSAAYYDSFDDGDLEDPEESVPGIFTEAAQSKVRDDRVDRLMVGSESKKSGS